MSGVQEHNGENLLNISGRDPGDFARKALRKLFTSDELATSVLPSRYDHLYLKKPLDKERFELLNSKPFEQTRTANLMQLAEPVSMSYL